MNATASGPCSARKSPGGMRTRLAAARGELNEPHVSRSPVPRRDKAEQAAAVRGRDQRLPRAARRATGYKSIYCGRRLAAGSLGLPDLASALCTMSSRTSAITVYARFPLL